MQLLTAAINAAVVAAVGIILAWLARGRFEAMDRRFDRLEERLDTRMDAFQASLDTMRSDLTQVALEIGVRRRATNP
jgi:hypothetical protein